MARLDNLDHLFNPRSVAFVGATQAKIKWGFIVFNNLLAGGYAGKVYPVNPGHQEILGLRCYPSIRDVPGEIELAIFTVPAKQVLATIEDCKDKGIKAGLVISAGFGELGDEGMALQAELLKKAGEAGMVLAGPNGQGVCCPQNSFYPWMPLFYPRAGSVGVICQSGNILNMIIGEVLEAGFGVSKGVSSGNEADLKTEDYLSYLARDPATEVMVAYIEGIEDGRRFLELSREAAQRKPVVVLKGGRTSAGMKAASSHTGAMAVESQMFESACRQAGLVVEHTIEQAGITDRGLEIARLSSATLGEIGSMLPDYWVPGNPVDLVAGLDLTVVRPILETLMKCGEVDSVLFIFIESQRSKGISVVDAGGLGVELGALWDMMTQKLSEYLRELYGLANECGVPLFVSSNFDRVSDGVPATLGGGDNPMVYEDVESACAAIAAMADYSRFRGGSGG
jgi:acyl-CoA synthetase (NDP forming)